MSFVAIIGLILEALAILIPWLENRHKKNLPLTDRQKRVLGHVLARTEKLRTEAANFGCYPQEDTAGDAAVKSDAQATDWNDTA